MATYTPNPDNHPAAVVLPDDSTPPNAAALNTPSEASLDLIAYTEKRGAMASLVTLQPAISSGGPFGGAAPFAFCWNNRPPASNEATAQSWLVTGYSGGITVYWTAGEDTTWQQVGTTLSTPNAATDIDVSTAGTVWLASTDGAHADTWKMAPGAGAFSVVGTNAITTCTDVQLAQAPAGSGSAMYIAAGSSTPTDARLGSTQDAGSISFGGTYTATTWILKSNGAYGLAIPAQAAASPQVIKSNADGSVWTPSAIGIAAADVPTDLAWNAVQGLWLLAVNVGGGAFNPTAFWTSPDGVNWTKVQTLSSINRVQAVGAVGPYFFCADSDLSSTPKMRLFTCRDNAVTWTQTAARVIGTATANTAALRSSPNQLAMAAQLSITSGSPTNAPLRFSGQWGAGDAVVT